MNIPNISDIGNICNNEKNESQTILSIDIGIQHLGISVSIVSSSYELIEVIWIDLIDITQFKCDRSSCKLYHTRTFSDWIDHFIEKNLYFFENSDIILLEKQPPQGLVVVEQLIFSKYREKSKIISPRKMHTYLNISTFDYDTRKEYSIKIAEKYLGDSMKEQLKTYERKHDISDTICILLYYLYIKNDEYKRKKRMESLNKDLDGLTIMDRLEFFKRKK